MIKPWQSTGSTLKTLLLGQENCHWMDVGCGDSTQTTFFSGHVRRTIGVDVSQAAIDITNKTKAAAGVTYQVVDLLNHQACLDFHDSLDDDAHIYM
jgi:methylase of polypeptide subunit release factors